MKLKYCIYVMSNYINKSVKGKSIITNVDITGECNTENITNQSGSNYNIGSSSSTFKTLYMDNINLCGGNLRTTQLISLNQGEISLNINSNHFGVSNGNLILTANTTQSVISPLINTQGSIKLNIDAPFIVNDNKLDLALATTLSTFGVPIGKMFVNENNKLNFNLDG